MDILIKPAANLGHLEELLVITQAGDQMPEKEKKDLAQSAVEGAIVATQQRASDILAERLPGLNNPAALADTPPAPDHGSVNPDTVPVKLHPPPALHADHYSPNTTPQANSLTPGQLVVDPKYAQTPASTPPAASAAAAPAGKAAAKADNNASGEAAGQKADQTAPAKPHHSSTSTTGSSTPTSGDTAAPGTAHPAVAKPKAPKAPPSDQPPAAAPAVQQPSAGPPADSGNGSPPPQ
jgi:rod shape-determining protein MreC